MTDGTAQVTSNRRCAHDELPSEGECMKSIGLEAMACPFCEIERLRAQVKALQTYPPMLFDPETGTITPLRTADETESEHG